MSIIGSSSKPLCAGREFSIPVISDQQFLLKLMKKQMIQTTFSKEENPPPPPPPPPPLRSLRTKNKIAADMEEEPEPMISFLKL